MIEAVVKVKRLRCERKKKVLARLIERQGNLCHWCKREMTPVKVKGDGNPKDSSATIEHLIPLRDGGRNFIENMVAACYRCNTGRQHEIDRNNARPGDAP